MGVRLRMARARTPSRLTPLRLALLLGIGLGLLRLGGCRPLDHLELRAIDYRLLQRGRQAPAREVVIVAVDDASIAARGRWPWSRAAIAQLVDRLVAADAAVIGFDVVQSEATVTSELEGLRERLDVDETTWTTIRTALDRGASEDRQLVEAIRRSNRSVLGYFFDFNREADHAGAEGPFSTYNLVQQSSADSPRLRTAPAIVPNLPELTAAARDTGYFNFIPDPDGYFRRVPLVLRYQRQLAVPLSLAMLRVYRPDEPLLIRLGAHGVESVRAAGISIPVGADGQMLVNYRGPGRTFLHVAAADVLDGRVPPQTFGGKLVLVGVTAAAVADVRAAAFDPVLPGVEIHATTLDNILRRDFIRQPAWGPFAEAGIVFLVALGLGVALHFAHGVYGALCAAAVLAVYVAGSQWVFLRFGLPLGVTYPVLAIVVTYVAISVQHYVVEEREKRKIRNAFGLYLPPALATLVSEHPEMLALGGDKRDLTVLFSDIRGFTTISEGLEPEALVELLNEYLGAMTEVIFEHEGTLDKYIGDAIMAVWGAPIPQEEHALRACRAALGMVSRLRELTGQWGQRGVPALEIGIGLNTGPMVVGNMGSARRLSYTVIGDNVNLGSRLEGLNKIYGSGIIASESTWLAAGERLVGRELDLVRVKGKRLPVRIFEILAPNTQRPQWQLLLDHFNAGLTAFRGRRWEEALAGFTAALAERPDDGPSRLYVDRCRAMLESPPAADWDGVTVMEVK